MTDLTASRPVRRVPLPRAWTLRASDVAALAIGNGFLILAMWLRHGGLIQLDTLAGMITAAGQLTALYGTYLVLIQLVLMSRSPWLDQLLGIERIAWLHRWVGFAAIWLLGAHGVLTTVGYAFGDGNSIPGELWTLLTTYPYVLWATAGMGLLVAVGVASMRAVRARVSYETWYGIHLYAYLAIALTFLHQLVVGTDFSDDPIARLYWIGLYVLAAATILAFRWLQPLALFARHRFRVANIVPEGPGVVSVYVTGRDLDRLPLRAGQWFRWRFLTLDGWWRAHPFSISTAPSPRFIRFTVKDAGDWTERLQALQVGTPVIAEGPYGTLTAVHRTRSRILLLAAGIGITPLRALFEELPTAPGTMTLVYRAGRTDDLVLRREIDQLASLRRAVVHYLVGPRGRSLSTDPIGPAALRRLVPDVRDRDVFVCGPDAFIDTARASLEALGVPPTQVHWERFSY